MDRAAACRGTEEFQPAVKCPKCGFVSHPGLPQCKKCGHPFIPGARKEKPSLLASLLPSASLRPPEIPFSPGPIEKSLPIEITNESAPEAAEQLPDSLAPLPHSLAEPAPQPEPASRPEPSLQPSIAPQSVSAPPQ